MKEAFASDKEMLIESDTASVAETSATHASVFCRFALLATLYSTILSSDKLGLLDSYLLIIIIL